MGFDFAHADDRPVETAHDIVRRLPRARLGGLVSQRVPQRVVEVANTLGLSAVQIDGAISRGRTQLHHRTGEHGPAHRARRHGEARAVAAGVDYLVLPESDERQALADSLEQLADRDHGCRSSPRAD